jgi:hypothetical protein
MTYPCDDSLPRNVSYLLAISPTVGIRLPIGMKTIPIEKKNIPINGDKLVYLFILFLHL